MCESLRIVALWPKRRWKSLPGEITGLVARSKKFPVYIFAEEKMKQLMIIVKSPQNPAIEKVRNLPNRQNVRFPFLTGCRLRGTGLIWDGVDSSTLTSGFFLEVSSCFAHIHWDRGLSGEMSIRFLNISTSKSANSLMFYLIMQNLWSSRSGKWSFS